ncbi:hypothetical protein [Brevibacillus daliensis]|nr:hypothetical protein [Brevibacillus daliensis]
MQKIIAMMILSLCLITSIQLSAEKNEIAKSSVSLTVTTNDADPGW